jgi:hypothetical protein
MPVSKIISDLELRKRRLYDIIRDHRSKIDALEGEIRGIDAALDTINDNTHDNEPLNDDQS